MTYPDYLHSLKTNNVSAPEWVKAWAKLTLEPQTETDQCFCPSYVDDNRQVQNCTCGKCK